MAGIILQSPDTVDGAGCINFLHSQAQIAALNRFAATPSRRKERHAQLAAVFSQLAEESAFSASNDSTGGASDSCYLRLLKKKTFHQRNAGVCQPPCMRV
jgi:hypothetical protein